MKQFHLLNKGTCQVLHVDRRSDDLRQGKMRKYDDLKQYQIARILRSMNSVPTSTIIYSDGYSVMTLHDGENLIQFVK